MPLIFQGFTILAQHVATQAFLDSGHIADAPNCHPATRVAILADLQEWASGLTYNCRIKWISGSAGVGKTAIMRTTAETLKQKNLLLACFFFWRTGERCNTAEFLIATLAYQIAVSLPETRPHIERTIEKDPHIFAKKLQVQSKALIVDPIVTVYRDQALPKNHPHIFVIDGLDECLLVLKQHQDVKKQQEVLGTFHWILQELPDLFVFLIASRPEYHIQTVFDSSLEEISSHLELNCADASADIKRFYVDQFREIREHHPLRSFLPSPDWPSRRIIDILVGNASGQFIYASTVTKFVGAAKKDPSRQLEAILNAKMRGNTRPFQPLDTLYSTILSTIDEEDLSATLGLLGAIWITRSYNGRSITFWDCFLRLRQGEASRLALGLESVLFVKKETCGFYHASLSDFLFDSQRSGSFFIDPSTIYEELAKQGIRHLWINRTDDSE